MNDAGMATEMSMDSTSQQDGAGILAGETFFSRSGSSPPSSQKAQGGRRRGRSSNDTGVEFTEAAPLTDSKNAAGSSLPPLLSVREAARLLNVSQTWVRRHAKELSGIRLSAHALRFDSALLTEYIQARMASGKCLNREQSMTQFRRWQRGSVVKRGSKTKIWVGIFREDVVQPDGTITRKQKRVPLGTVREIPTRYAAMNKLREILEQPVKKTGISFAELVTRWQAAVVPSLKTSTADVYNNAIRLYLLPAFGDKDITTINREAIELFLAKQARTYCRSTLRNYARGPAEIVWLGIKQ